MPTFEDKPAIYPEMSVFAEDDELPPPPRDPVETGFLLSMCSASFVFGLGLMGVIWLFTTM